MPQAGDLPTALAGLARLNALRVGYQSCRNDVTRLVEALADELGIIPTPGLQTAETAVGPGPEPRRTRSGRRGVQMMEAGREEEQRARLLSRLSRTYTEYLYQSVEHDAVLKLQLELDGVPGRTFRPQDRLLPTSHRQAERLPVGTSLLQAFEAVVAAARSVGVPSRAPRVRGRPERPVRGGGSSCSTEVTFNRLVQVICSLRLRRCSPT